MHDAIPQNEPIIQASFMSFGVNMECKAVEKDILTTFLSFKTASPFLFEIFLSPSEMNVLYVIICFFSVVHCPVACSVYNGYTE